MGFLNKKLSGSKDQSKKRFSEDESGMAVLETVPLLVVFIVLMTYAMGYWGAIHGGILNSMAARTYAFETMRNRSNLTMFRETSNKETFYKQNFRFHAVNGFDYGNVKVSAEEFYASRYPISFDNFQVDEDLTTQRKVDLHRQITSVEEQRITRGRVKPEQRVNPIWVKIGYGYCLNIQCEE